ncbi:XdhC family protein [Halovivax gelatinilyticus]|uniref:XdhC family protein n=1 Tax=Halovivax gelatinilyticus TaxID=2961597 RepID=UPI0020CA3E4A|nr:XdhC/CoxI family protein [Halovivax gelatinilyticus]
MDGTGAFDPWSVPTRDLYDRIGASDGPLAVATVVGVEGSAYRPPGAKMVLEADGTTFGAVTAGCLEGPLAAKARSIIDADDPRVVTFDLTDDGEGWGLGLGCDGVVDVLVEPVDAPWRRVAEAVADGEKRVLVTAVDGDGSIPVGSRAVCRPVDPSETPHASGDVSIVSTTLPDSILESITDEIERCADDGTWLRRDVSTADGTVCLFVDGLSPPDHLLVFGGQPDVRPVARLARAVGFRVTVATARGGRADPANFPAADRVVSTHPTDLASLADERTYVVCMSHNFVDDRLALQSLLETPVPYVGLMGPLSRFDDLRAELNAEGVTLSPADEARIAAPVGLDLGGGEPIEIAMSVVSEVLAASNDRDGGPLTEREGPIHDESATEVD